MVFSSPAFLFFFFPAVFLLGRAIRSSRGSSVLLTCAGLVFYAFGGLKAVPVLLISFVWSYLAGLALMGSRSRRKLLCAAAVIGDLALLLIYKYLPFLLNSVNGLFSMQLPVPTFALPLGISFFTFHAVSYAVDVYRDPDCGERNIFRLFIYLFFFPRLLAGPIVRYSEAREQLACHPLSPELTADGMRRFVRGLAKKVLLAESIGAMANGVWSLTGAELTAPLAWLGAAAYCLQLYYDFSGYSDMAIGLGRMFGFRFPENFDYPYAARSLTDFWRRWHITLNRWFVEYLYIPLGGSRRGNGRTVLNKMLVFLCTGIWHGAGWTYLLWGLWHGCFVSLEGVCRGFFRRMEERGWLTRGALRVYTLLVVLCGFVMFRSATVGEGLRMLGAMFSAAPAGTAISPAVSALLTPSRVLALVLGAVFAFPAVPTIRKRLFSGHASVLLWTDTVLAVLGLALSVLALSAGGFTPFLYQQF